MKNNRLNIALLAPSLPKTSETFIKVHREKLEHNIFFLYGAFMPTHKENGDILEVNNNFLRKIKNKIGILKSQLTYTEQALKQYLIENKIEVVLAEYGPVGAEVCRVCRELYIPLIVHFHGFDAHKKNVVKSYSVLYQQLFRYASFIIVVSNLMKDTLIAMGAPDEKIILNPCGPSELFLSNKYDSVSNTFLAVGRFTKKKAPYLTLAAFKLVHDIKPDAKLIFAGDGLQEDDLSEVCYNLTKALDLTEAVSFTGPTTPQQVKKLMESSCCFVQHSITSKDGDSEGTPVAILEAGLAGLPVVSTLHAGIMDVVIHGKTGFLVKEGDVKGMANYMLRVLDSKEEAKLMGQEARTFISNNFTVAMHLSIIEDVISRSIV